MPAINQWNNLTLTFNSENNEGKIYLNQNLIHEFVSESVIESSEIDLHIGGNSYVNADYNTLDGFIDDIQILDIALDENQINELYLDNLNIQNNLIAQYKFNSGTGLYYMTIQAMAIMERSMDNLGRKY